MTVKHALKIGAVSIVFSILLILAYSVSAETVSMAPPPSSSGVLTSSSVSEPTSILTPTPSPMPTPVANQPFIIPTPPNVNATAYILMDANSGKIIAEKNKDLKAPPASLTKLMTLYLTFQALQSGKIRLDTMVPISQKAWRTGGSKMFVRVGTTVSVQDLLQGIIVDSGNDACVAMAEFLAGSEDSFANMMNTQAKLLGMNNTFYMDCTGMPNPNHYTTAYDLALLAQNMVQNFPQFYAYFSQKWFSYNGIRQPNRNRLLWRFPGTDGLKTGHTNDAGYCLVSSAVREGMRLIAVIMGAPSDEVRASDSIQLLTYGFRFYTTRSIYPAGTVIVHPRVWFGSSCKLNAGIRYNLAVTVPQGPQQDMLIHIRMLPNLMAPLLKGQTVGQITVTQGNDIIASQPLIALEPIDKGGIFRRLWDSLIRLFVHSGQPKEVLQKLVLPRSTQAGVLNSGKTS